MRMRAVVYKGYHSFEIMKCKKPVVSKDNVLIQVTNCGISDVDVDTYLGQNPMVVTPRILGNQICGIVREVNSLEDSNNLPGAKVVVDPIVSCGYCSECKSGRTDHCKNMKIIGITSNGGFAEFVEVPITNIHFIPEHSEIELYVIASSLAMAIHTASMINESQDKNIVILGSKPVDLLCGLILKRRKYLSVDIIDSNLFRLDIAKSMGLSCINLDETNFKDIIHQRCLKGNGDPDIVIELAGNEQRFNLAAELVKIQGQIILLGIKPKERAIYDFAHIIENEISVLGSKLYTKDDFLKAIEDISNHSSLYNKLITHRLPLKDVFEGIRILEKIDESMNIVISV